MNSFIKQIENELLPNIHIESIHPYDPVVIHSLPSPWQKVGTGNYAAVVCHPDYPDLVVKIYAPGRPGFAEEVAVYQQIGDHPAYSKCYYYGENFLVLKRMYGTTLFECFHKGIPIPVHVINDVDKALSYARGKELTPHDIHGKNVVMHKGHGYVVDISDFYKKEPCSKWKDLKKAYFKLYYPFFYRHPIKIPYFVLNFIRKSYRLYKRMKAAFNKL